jgi:hypothetical protein
MTTELLSSSEFCRLRYDSIPVKSSSANVSLYTKNSKMPYFVLWHFFFNFNFNLFSIHLIHEGYDPSDMELVNTEMRLQISYMN